MIKRRQIPSSFPHNQLRGRRTTTPSSFLTAVHASSRVITSGVLPSVSVLCWLTVDKAQSQEVITMGMEYARPETLSKLPAVPLPHCQANADRALFSLR